MTSNETIELSVAVCVDEPRLRQQVADAADSLGYRSLSLGSDPDALFRLPQRSILIADETWFRCSAPDRLVLANEFRPRRVMLHIVARGNVEGALNSVRAGACNVLEQPVDDAVLIKNIQAAVELEAKFATRRRMVAQCHWSIDSLDRIETEILNALIDGRTNKEIARALGISLRGIESRRAQIMVKLNVTTLAQLIAFVTSEQIRAAIEPLREFESILMRHSSF